MRNASRLPAEEGTELHRHSRRLSGRLRKLLEETGRIASIATRDWVIIGQS
jgi:hypothetical protein